MTLFLSRLPTRRSLLCSLPRFSRTSVQLQPQNSSSSECHLGIDKNVQGVSRTDNPKWRNKATGLKEGASVVEVSPETRSFVERLRKDGYLKEETFGTDGDPCRLRVYKHSLGFLQDALERFGREHQEIAKWLSGKHLKEVALLGCPSTDRKTVYAAKRLRSFFSIQEDNVCMTCPLRESCKFKNKKTKRDVKLILLDPLFVLIGYALRNPTSSQKYLLSDGANFSISKILKEVVNLSS